ncbi:uncharacterized protein J3D65DRAFT_328585 [Phyllosticta citribraziliensis]|uniref:Uncharacterized protein n=1 Tax=Phyllosticta citribraziliensis TaxID=989973 RepID=A0ABR1LTH1_9PEZI
MPECLPACLLACLPSGNGMPPDAGSRRAGQEIAFSDSLHCRLLSSEKILMCSVTSPVRTCCRRRSSSSSSSLPAAPLRARGLRPKAVDIDRRRSPSSPAARSMRAARLSRVHGGPMAQDLLRLRADPTSNSGVPDASCQHKGQGRARLTRSIVALGKQRVASCHHIPLPLPRITSQHPGSALPPAAQSRRPGG